MNSDIVKPQVVREDEVSMVGPGYNEDHYITVPIKQLYTLEGLANVGVCFMEPGQETCVFAIDEEDDHTALHYYGAADEFYYIIEGEFTVWWGKDASNLDNSYALKKGDCAYYPRGWKYQVKNTGESKGKFFYVMTRPEGIQRRFDKK
jgi:mannose-6-phosphate isomerase-like protein (cupin superfamily)